MARSIVLSLTWHDALHRPRWFSGGILAIWLLCGVGVRLSAAHYVVVSTSDGVDTTVLSGSGSTADPYQVLSLRAAVLLVNGGGGGDTIVLPEGTYELTIGGEISTAATGEAYSGDAAKGDLDISANNTTLEGAGATTTIIQQTTPWQAVPSYDRILEVNPFLVPGFTFTLRGVTLQGGATPDGGGGLACGGPDALTHVQACVFMENQSFGPASGGGAIQAVGGGVLEVGACTFAHNTSVDGSGGAIAFLASPDPGRLSVSGSVFRQNSSGNHGGAIDVAGRLSGNSYVNNCLFVANAAARQGGALSIAAAGDGVILQFNRFFDNSNSSVDEGSVLHRSGLAQVVADDNWWGVNTGPGPGDYQGFAIDTWLQLRFAAEAISILPDSSTVLTADLLGRNMGDPVPAMNLNGLPAFPDAAAALFMEFGLGSLSDAVSQMINGLATTTFTADQGAGYGTVEITVDQQTLSLDMEVPTTVTGIQTLDPDPTGAAEVRWAVTFAHPLEGLTVANFELEIIGLSGISAIISVSPDGAVPTASWLVTASTGLEVGTLGLNLLTDTDLSAPIANLPFIGETYALVDQLPPEFVCAADRTVTCGDLWEFDAPMATDARDPAPSIQILATETNVLSGGAFEVIRTWLAADQSGNTASCTQTITVGDATPLVAGTDYLGVLENESVSVPMSELLANDTDEGGSSPSLTSVSAASLEGGILTLVGETVVYSPPFGFAGEDQFTYTITDGCGLAQGVVVVTIVDAEDPGLNRLTLALPAGVPHLEFMGAPHRAYVFQRAPTPAGPWADLTPPLTPDLSGFLAWDDLDVPLPPLAFYRVLEAP